MLLSRSRWCGGLASWNLPSEMRRGPRLEPDPTGASDPTGAFDPTGGDPRAFRVRLILGSDRGRRGGYDGGGRPTAAQQYATAHDRYHRDHSSTDGRHEREGSRLGLRPPVAGWPCAFGRPSVSRMTTVGRSVRESIDSLRSIARTIRCGQCAGHAKQPPTARAHEHLPLAEVSCSLSIRSIPDQQGNGIHNRTRRSPETPHRGPAISR